MPQFLGPVRLVHSAAMLSAVFLAALAVGWVRLQEPPSVRAADHRFASAGPVFVPRVAAADCNSGLAIQNLSTEGQRAVVLGFAEGGADCRAPIALVCTGLLAPGATWRVNALELGDDLASAVVFGLRDGTRLELGLGAPNDLAAGALCSDLQAVLTDCALYAELLDAYRQGLTWRGWPMASIAGGPLAVQVEMRCPSATLPGTDSVGGYLATANHAAQELTMAVPAGAQVWVQNASGGLFSVAVRSRNSACALTDCPAMAVGPGGARLVDVAACVGAAGGTIRLSAPGPIVGVLEHEGETLTMDLGEPLVPLDPGGVPRRKRVGALIRDPQRGWSAEVAVTNLDREAAAHVDVTFVDGKGRSISTQRLELCQGGSGVAALAAADEMPGERVGSVRAEVVGGPGRIAGIVRLRGRINDGGQGEEVSYPLVSDPARVIGAGERPAAVALPIAVKNLDQDEGTSEIAIANTSRAAGWTQVAVLFYDKNDLVDVMCHRLVAGETRSVHLERQGLVAVGFTGSAVVVPTAWDHAVGPNHEVGIAVASVTRFRASFGQDVPGDEAYAVAGVPWLDLPPEIVSAAEGNCTVAGLLEPVGPTPFMLEEAATAVSYAPVLTQRQTGAECTAELVITNSASEPGHALVVFAGLHDPACDCVAPSQVTCSPLLAPGGSWELVGASVPTGAKSATVYGFSDGAGINQVCERLAEAVDCHVLRRFHLAFGTGGDFDGTPMAGAPLEGMQVRVRRVCPGVSAPGAELESAYIAPAHPYEPASANWRSLAYVLADSGNENSVVHIQNVGFACTDVSLEFKANGDCLRHRTCSVPGVPPGGSVSFPASACVGPDFEGSVVVHGREPLAVVADRVSANSPERFWTHPSFAGRLPQDVDGDGDVTLADQSAVRALAGVTSADPEWDARLDLTGDGVIDSDDERLVTAALCGTDPGPAAPAAPAAADRHVLLPSLGDPDATCDLGITIQNLGDETTGVVLLLWEAPTDTQCTPPFALLCSPILHPGGSWFVSRDDLERASGASAGEVARSAMAFSFSTRPVGELVPIGIDDPVWQIMCETLFFNVIGDCADYSRFKTVWDQNAEFAGLPMDLAKGEPIAVVVGHTGGCDLFDDPSRRVTSSGVGTHELGSRDSRTGSYVYRAPMFFAEAADYNTSLRVQNDGPAPANVQVTLRAQDDCSAALVCPSFVVAPGAAVAVTCLVGPDFQGSARVESNQPLAVVAQTTGRRLRLWDWRAMAGEYTAVAAHGSPGDARGRGTDPISQLRAFAPLLWSTDSGADSFVQVANLDDSRPAQVQVVFRDANGQVTEVLEDLICPDGTQTFFAPVVNNIAPGQPWSAEVSSIGPHGAGAQDAVPIHGLAGVFRYTDPARSTPEEFLVYELIPGNLGAPAPDQPPVQVIPAPGEPDIGPLTGRRSRGRAAASDPRSVDASYQRDRNF